MLNQIQTKLKKVFGTQNERELKSIAPLVSRINSLESAIQALSDADLKAKTPFFKERLAKGETLDSILPEAFAVCREASKRHLGMRHYDVQLIGGITLHRGRIAEMKTGEGKTLVATLPVYLNALSGKGVHVITVNDYLARRDAEQMGQLYGFLGLSTGIIVHGLSDFQRKKNYGADVSYGTNNEFGFDYLRDNMKFRLEDYVQRELNFAIVDEVDSILIDEARTPLIISGPSEDSIDLYYEIDKHIRNDGGLVKDVDYTVDEKSKTASLSEAGVDKMEKRLKVTNLYNPTNIELLHHVNQALRAHVLYKRDVDYVVKDGQVLIVDEFTGRLMPGRRWSDGLHQAIEAREGVVIEGENQTLATITFQNYFRMYNKLSGMTGTADTEATEFKQIYKLDVTVIPTNKPMIRKDEPDVIFKTELGKFKAIADEIKTRHEKGQPILVGTISIEKSELLGQLLKKEGIKHSVLNAKQHEREAEIVALAGRKGSVTIATNMAGRGTDILLGGNPEVLAKAEVGSIKSDASLEEKEAHKKLIEETIAKLKVTYSAERHEVIAAGGLFILGTERHESRRIDNQLRGRAGRQGDSGGSKFFLSLEDDLMRIFGAVNIARFMEDDMPIEHRLITKAIANAQKKVEGHNYDIRKHLLEYDDVMNQQRKVVYGWRREVLSREDLKTMVMSMLEEMIDKICDEFFPGGNPPRGAHIAMNEISDAFAITFSHRQSVTEKDLDPFNAKGLKAFLMKAGQDLYTKKEAEVGEANLRRLEKVVLLSTIDQLWKDHLLAMDHLREGIGLRGYGQKDPLIEYKKEGYRFFEMMMGQINQDVVRKLYAVQMQHAQHLDADGEDDQEMEDGESRTPVANKAPTPTRQVPTGIFAPSAQKPAKIMYNLTPDGKLVGSGPSVPNVPGANPSLGNANLQNARSGNTDAVQTNQQSPTQAEPSIDFDKMMKRKPQQMTLSRGGLPGASGNQPGGQTLKTPDDVEKVGRNDVCPCGSGKKYKKCHGA